MCNVYPKDLDEHPDKEKFEWRKKHFINRVNFCGFSALHLAAQNGHNQTLRELLYAGCSTSLHNDYGDTPLHTACRYGHAGVVRILISAKCDPDAFNLNHDTPLHITCAMGRRKLTKLLLDAGAMQFQNLQHESPRDIAQRKNLNEILDIMKSHSEKMDKRLIREAARSSKSPNAPHLLPHNSKLNQDQQNPRHWSPYGCHYYPDTRNFPSPRLESLPKDPLEKGEQYYLDLGGNIRKGPVGKGNKCFCAPFDTNVSANTCRNGQKHAEKANKKINELAGKIEKTEEKNQHRRSRRERSKDVKVVDPLYPLLRIVGDKNKQLHLKTWLTKVYPDIGSNSDLQPSPRGSETVKEVAADVHHQEATTKVCRNNSRLMPKYDETGINELQHEDDDDDENYTDISNESEESGNGSIASNNENGIYDESFLRNFQRQQFVQQNDSITSPSVSSNQNIELEMEKITKSLLLNDDGLMVNRKPDVIKDHIQHSAKRSTKKIKSAITMPTASASSVLASGDLYVNSFFRSEAGRKENEHDSLEIDELIAKVHQTILNSSNVSTVSSSAKDFNNADRGGAQNWNQSGRSRNPLPMNIDEIEVDTTDGQQVTTTLNDNNFVLLDQLMKARKKFNQSYQQQLEMMNQPTTAANIPSTHDNRKANEDFTIPSSSTLV